MNKNPIRGGVEQGEQACYCEAFVAKVKRRISGSRAVKDCVLTWGDLALCLKGQRLGVVSEKSAEAIVAVRRRAEREGGLKIVKTAEAWHQKLGRPGRREEDWVKPCLFGGVVKLRRRNTNRRPRATSTSRIARCGPACRVVWEGRAFGRPLSR
jgi:hypothetical protein